MFFPPDITHLRFTRSHELKADEARRQREHAADADVKVTLAAAPSTGASLTSSR